MRYITVHCTGPNQGQDQRYHRKYPVHNHDAKVQFRYDASAAASQAWHVPILNIDTGRVVEVDKPPVHSILI